MARPRSMDGHRDDIPGLIGNACWCGKCQSRCGGDGPRCICCGGSPANQPAERDTHWNPAGEAAPAGVQQPQAGTAREAEREKREAGR